MKAVYIEEHGGIDALTYGDLPEPAVGPNDVKLRVRATSINRLDLFTRAGVRGHPQSGCPARTCSAGTRPGTSSRPAAR